MWKTINNEKGIALVLSLMVLAALTLIGIAAIMTSTLDMQIAGNERTIIQSQYAAEAGLAETIGRLNLPKTHTKYVGQQTDPTWAANVNNTYTNWVQGFNGTINSTDDKTMFNYSVSVRYKPLPSRPGSVAFYNNTSGYSKSRFASEGPVVFLVKSTGTSGVYRSGTVLELTRNTYDYQVTGGLSAKGNITVAGNSTIDGNPHDVNGNAGGNCTFSNLTGIQPAISTSGATVNTQGNPDLLPLNSSQTNQTYAPVFPWDVLGMTKSEFDAVFTNVYGMTYSGPLREEILVQGTGTFHRVDITGNGILVVHNPLFVPGTCETGACAPATLLSNGGTFKGIIIADKIDLQGNLRIIGAAVSLSTIETSSLANGNPEILYSCDAIQQFAGGKTKKKLAWKRLAED